MAANAAVATLLTTMFTIASASAVAPDGVDQPPSTACIEHGPRFQHAGIDAVVPASTTVCTTSLVIDRLKRYMGVRTVYVVAPTLYMSQCAAIASERPYVTCLDENAVLPGVTYSALEQRASQAMRDSRRVGWYLQQFIKLGVALHLPALSSQYLVWDADVIALSGVELQNATHTRLCSGRVDARSAAVGGAQSPHQFYTLLTGLQWKGQGVVANYACGYMLLDKAVVSDLLAHVDSFLQASRSASTSSAAAPRFPWSVFELANEHVGANLHFSEYDTYGSWLLARHGTRTAVVEVAHTRNPRVLTLRALRRRSCCLEDEVVCEYGALNPGVSLLMWEEHKLRELKTRCQSDEGTGASTAAGREKKAAASSKHGSLSLLDYARALELMQQERKSPNDDRDSVAWKTHTRTAPGSRR